MTLTCYGCEDLDRDCCGSAAVSECFYGLYVSGAEEIYIHHPFDLFLNTTGAYVADREGHYALIPLSGTDFGTIGSLSEYLEKCRCGGVFRQEYYGITGTSIVFTENNGHIPSDQDKCHLIVDGREKRLGEWSASGDTITTTFNIFSDNRVTFWYQLF